MEHISINEIKDKLDFFSKMYDSVRLVDPVNKRVVDCRDASPDDKKEICYDYWGNGRICDNCISVRAHNEEKSFFKLEKSMETIMLVTAIPVENKSKPVVLEMMKNTTDSMMVGTGNYSEGELLNRFVREINDIIVRDSLTSLYNRRFVDERLPVDIINSTLKDQPLSVCFIDMDNFKMLNDLNGHEAGDWAMKAVASVIMKHIRSEHDWAARYGGDEFLLCLNNTDEKQAHTILERIQCGIEKIPMKFNLENTNLSISFGIETMKDVPRTAEELIRLSDKKMYKDKKNKQQEN
ncbi:MULTISPECIES: GGDEF domain-containing protein [unclassified Sedimentibacter]|uniref:GGDEF domain-containing protein n=1 Tax=unclassified Sedimentibacter TaxID=2649220 RepID=UPI0027E0DBC7|nr:GGDEF domain-containing protein [Sedimentibacter sp. MB35-C1]WMJ75984.1 GGDEF domain-containing protein [Sedimentibacter sp. MB35-C1]